MKSLVKVIVVVLVIVVGMAFIIPSFIPVERVVAEAKQQVFEQTGRNMNISTAPSVAIFPNLHIAIENIVLSNPEGMPGDMLTIKHLLINVGWSTLWQGELAIEDFELDNWQLTLQSDAKGHNNWTFSHGAEQASSSTSNGSGAIDIPADIDLAIVKCQLSRGSVEIIDAGGQSQRIDNINVAMNMPSLDQTLAIQGHVDWQGQTLKSQLSVTNVRDLLAGKLAKVELNFSGLQNQLAFIGSVDGMGQVIRGDLDLGTVDLRNLLSSEKSADTQATVQGWDETPIDLSGLKGPDVKLGITMAALYTPWLNTEKFAGSVSLQKGLLAADIEQFSAYQGMAKGSFSLDASDNTMAAKLDFSAVQIQGLLKDLADVDKLMGVGSVNFDVNARASSVAGVMNSLNGQVGVNLADGAVLGFNLAAVIKSADSAIKGNFSEVSLDKNFSAAEKTDFSSMNVELDVKKGIASIKQLALLSPLVRVGGEGSIDLPKQTMDVLLRSSLVASAEGQGGNTDAKGLTIPVAISGPWAKVKIAPKVSDAAKTKAKAYIEEQKEKFINDKIKDEGAKKLLKGLFSR